MSPVDYSSSFSLLPFCLTKYGLIQYVFCNSVGGMACGWISGRVMVPLPDR